MHFFNRFCLALLICDMRFLRNNFIGGFSMWFGVVYECLIDRRWQFNLPIHQLGYLQKLSVGSGSGFYNWKRMKRWCKYARLDIQSILFIFAPSKY